MENDKLYRISRYKYYFMEYDIRVNGPRNDSMPLQANVTWYMTGMQQE